MSAPWVKWTIGALLWLYPAAPATGIFQSGIAENWLRGVVIRQLEQRTGARVEMGGFHLDLWHLRLAIDNLTLHGTETPNEPPLFHAGHVDAGIRIVSFLGRQIALDELTVDHPYASVRIDKNGRSNLPPAQAHAGSRPWRDTLFRLRISRVELRDGGVAFNDQRVPLSMQGGNFELALSRAGASVAGAYLGSLRWQQVEWKERRFTPFRFDLSAKFTLRSDTFELDELAWKLPHSELNFRAELASFSRPDWNLWYRGRLALEDVRTIFRKPTTPEGQVEFSGQAHYAPPAAGNAAEWTASGHYAAREVRMAHKWFHAQGMEAWGDFTVARGRLTVPHLSVRAFGGTADGQLDMDLRGLAFRTETHLHGASLAAILAAVNGEDFPVEALHWDAAVDVNSVNTWSADFKHFRTEGEMRWAAPAVARAGRIPVTAEFAYDYGADQAGISIGQAEIRTPRSLVRAEGVLGAEDSALEFQFQTGELLDWNDFINAIRGQEAVPHLVAGRAEFRGRVLGPLAGPTFAGRASVNGARYDTFAWDSVEGNLEYSPDGFRMTEASLRHGGSAADFGLTVQLDGDWSFLDSSSWTADAHFDRVSAGDLESLLGAKYGVSGRVSGELRGRGTRAAPVWDGSLMVRDIDARGWHFDSFSGELHWENGQVQLSRAELREDSELIAGDFFYRPREQHAEFHVAASGVELAKVQALQTPSLPVGGQLSLELRGSGPLSAPAAEGTLHLSHLQLGADAHGDFSGRLASDGRTARVTLQSESAQEKVEGEFAIELSGEEPVSGRLSVAQFDLRAFVTAALHLKQLTGHSSADGVFTISGALRRPESLEVDADLARIVFDYELVQLTNAEHIRAAYRRNEVRVDQARLQGAGTDLQFSGSARFDGDRPVRLALSGGVNLLLLRGVLPDLEARGTADVNVAVEGTLSQPRVTGRASVQDASANYADFPVGLSKVKGDLVFDRSRLLFEKVSAEAGGGQLSLTGTVTYGEGPVRYDVTVTTPQVRIRYPAGMSWLTGGTLELSGTARSALLTGRVGVERLLFAQGVDVVSLFAAAAQSTPGPPAASSFLQNLAFDVEGQTNPGARIEWTGARLEMDGDVRLRGTWDRPVLLGHIHLLGGEMGFRGNTFELTRGDIGFANPFRLDPELNVEATSTINQYQVTIDFSGTATQLSMNYRSDPPLPDSDVMALLALGSTGQAGGLRTQTSGTQNYGATALLTEAISTGVGGRIERLFGISQFRVDPFVAGTATEPNAAARLTIQQHLARGLDITYSTNAATSNQYQLIQVEYAVKRDLSVLFLRDVNGTYGFDIKWVKRFK